MVCSKPITPPLLLEHHSAAAHYSLQPQYGRLSNSQESAVKMSISIIFLNLLSFFQLLSSTVKISISASHCQGLDLQLVDAINPRGLPLYNKNCNVMALWHFDFLCSMTVVLQFSSDSLAVNQLEIERKKEKKSVDCCCALNSSPIWAFVIWSSYLEEVPGIIEFVYLGILQKKFTIQTIVDIKFIFINFFYTFLVPTGIN